MEIYYITIALFLLIGYANESERNGVKESLMFTTMFLFVIIFGFRYQVGVDWFNYIIIYERQIENPFKFDTPEIGYKFLNVLGYITDFDIALVILITTILFITFTMIGARELGLNPYFFFVVVAPYHFVISGMNFTRQSIALSIFIFSLSYLMKNKKLHYTVFILIAGTFHTSALAFMVLLFIDMKKRYIFLASISLIPIILYSMLNTYSMYITSELDNSGMILRVLYLATPISLLILHLNKVLEIESLIEKRLIYVSIASIPFLVMVSTISPVISDRFSYYFILLVSISTMRLKKLINVNGEQYIVNHASTLMFITSMIAFITWSIFSDYVPSYEFKSYLSVLIDK